jgi:hypothetical protein
MKKEEIHIGQKVFVLRINNMARGDTSPILEEDVIIKIGNKYFEIKSGRGKFNIETGFHVSDCCSNYKVYLTMQEYIDEKEHQTLYIEIYRKFSYLGNTSRNFTLKQLREIKKIIDDMKE